MQEVLNEMVIRAFPGREYRSDRHTEAAGLTVVSHMETTVILMLIAHGTNSGLTLVNAVPTWHRPPPGMLGL